MRDEPRATGTAAESIFLFASAFQKYGRKEFQLRYGSAFFLLCDGALQPPRRPSTTQMTPVTEIEGNGFRDVTTETSYLVFPVRRSGRANFPYVAIGRTDNNDIVLLDVTVSKFHAYIKEKENRYYLVDAGSSNGTYIDNVPVSARGDGPPPPLSNNNAVRFGAVLTTFLELDAFLDFIDRQLS